MTKTNMTRRAIYTGDEWTLAERVANRHGKSVSWVYRTVVQDFAENMMKWKPRGKVRRVTIKPE